MQYFVSFLDLQLARWKERAGCSTFIVFLKSCSCKSYYLFLSAMGWSAVCDCGIFWSVAILTFYDVFVCFVVILIFFLLLHNSCICMAHYIYIK